MSVLQSSFASQPPIKAVKLFNFCSYVVDDGDPDNLSISKSELHDFVSKPSLNGIPLLVLGNKTDKPGALSKHALADQIEQILELDSYNKKIKENQEKINLISYFITYT